MSRDTQQISSNWGPGVRIRGDIGDLAPLVEREAVSMEVAAPCELAGFLGRLVREVLPASGLTGHATAEDFARLHGIVAIYLPEALPHYTLAGEPFSGDAEDHVARAVLRIVMPAQGMRSERNLRAAMVRLLALILRVAPELLPGARPSTCAEWVGVARPRFSDHAREVASALRCGNGSFLDSGN